MESRNIGNIAGRPLAELRREFLEEERCLPRGLLEALEADPREGARRLAGAIRKRRSANRREGRRLRKLLQHESQLWDRGLERIAGVDEAGMAPLAGPVIAAAVILPPRYRLAGLDDSKKILNPARREEMALRIKSDAIGWAVGRAEVEEIDRINIYRAGLLAMQRAVQGLAPAPEYALVDARSIPDCPCPQVGIVHGDALSASIAAASIIAKTTRDALMAELDRLYPGYGLSSHKGYPTPEHCRILAERGPLPIHRRSFGPVAKVLGLTPVQKQLFEEPV